MNNTEVINIAKELGFELVGFSRADELNEESRNLSEWLNRGYHAGMKYMERNFDKRKKVNEILPAAESVISLGINYYIDEKHEEDETSGKVSRYAWGRDYHFTVWEKLDKFIEKCKAIDSAFEAKSYIDTGPVMDKAWAVKSGIGWMGKHTNVISREIGSWFFIANIITNIKFNYNDPIEDFCGSCTLCIDACPTGAIVQEYLVDSNKCISYLTIENKVEIPDEFKGKFEKWIFGCDICQDVCPWNNKFSVESGEQDFHPKGNKKIDLDDVEKMSDRQFKERFKESPVSRAKLKGLKRNAGFLKE